jgi:hypothetical protein
MEISFKKSEEMLMNPSNIDFLNRNFKDIIQNVKNTDQTGKSSNKIVNRATFNFIDGSYLSITEILKDGYIDYFHYDWYNKNKQVICKFHSERHEDTECQTSTEPYHIHVPDKNGLSNDKRLANEKHRDLISILELIKIRII